MKNHIFLILLLCLQLFACSDTSQVNTERHQELTRLYTGKKVPYAEHDVLGSPETLSGTNNMQWVAYYPKADFTIVTNKKTDIVRTVYLGRHEL
ncbi:hypothetical protein [Agarilytica rhodophyticola]|uniref:hypothetical protein n=1 Tax=Agarilytica rhodophyticola TaxID=1737490 RepID=UPI000CD82B9F|nr:hypothetical protein [Agarilytica rhodophyticola]